MSRSSPTRHVALIVETSNAYARGVLAGIRKFATERPRWSLYLAEHSRQEVDFSWLAGWDGHGVLARIENEETAQFIRELGLPTVDLSAKRFGPELPCVETDDDAIARWGVEHFVERGLRHVAFCGDERFGWSVNRAAAFSDHARRRGAVPHEFALTSSGRRSQDRERLAGWLRRLPHPVGVLACYDIAGQEVLEACKMAGLRVPDEVAVIGVDNDELICNLTSPPLSSIQPDTTRTGYLAAELLDAMMAGCRLEPGVRPIEPLRVRDAAVVGHLLRRRPARRRRAALHPRLLGQRAGRLGRAAARRAVPAGPRHPVRPPPRSDRPRGDRPRADGPRR